MTLSDNFILPTEATVRHGTKNAYRWTFAKFVFNGLRPLHCVPVVCPCTMFTNHAFFPSKLAHWAFLHAAGTCVGDQTITMKSEVDSIIHKGRIYCANELGSFGICRSNEAKIATLLGLAFGNDCQ